MSNKDDRIMVCAKCGHERPSLQSYKSKPSKSVSENLWCIKCKRETCHKEKSFYSKERKVLDCNEIFGNQVSNIDNKYLKCTMNNGLFIIFETVGQAADWVMLNDLTATERRDYILNRIRNVLCGKAQSVYGLNFSYVYLGLHGKYCFEPVGYCKLKGCYLSNADFLEKFCDLKHCKNFLEKSEI